MSIAHWVWYVPLLLVPFFLGLALDTLAWRLLLPGHKNLSYKRLLGIHIGTESLLLTLPGGFAAADAMKIALLSRGSGIDPMESLTSLLARRWMLGLSQVLFVLVAVGIGYGLFSGISRRGVVGIPSAPIIVLISAVSVLVIAVAWHSAANGNTVERLFWFLHRLSPRSMRRWLLLHHDSFLKVASYASAIRSQRRSLLYVLQLLLVVSWLSDAVESVLVAAVLGIDVGFLTFVVMEAILSIVKLLAFFLPSGIVVKELGYVALFNAAKVAVTGPQTAVFIAVKRIINVVWILVGFIVLFACGFRLKKKKNTGLRPILEAS